MKEIFERRSTRKYLDRPVEREKIEKILRAGMCAPSAGNEQPWHFLVVEDREDLIRLSKLHPHAAMLPEAAFAVILCADPSLQKYRFDFWIQDCSAAAENMLLEAEYLGVGGVWLGVYPNEERIKTIRPEFGIPDEIEILCLMSFGYPEFKKTAKDRWDESRVHMGRWKCEKDGN
ncbi:nitroreductase family protein [Clostridium transplantifaecale]|uniref:nitroreductase family protein n=1 Tax=Clostridium transplantifaecale TaxID=2479838 RepID=UPI000F642979|nr:nitroreductase family protein [Clostridium transplantifaecale]